MDVEDVWSAPRSFLTQITSLENRDRSHSEGFLVWNRTRTWRGQRAAAGAGRTISKAVIQSTVLRLRNLLDDITEWGWEQAPTRRLVFAADVLKLDLPLPRALPPDIDTAVMNAVAQLIDPFARIGLTVLRGAGLRVGELLDLELGSVIDYGPAGTWLKVPLGKLATERMVPLSAGTIAALDEWTGRRGLCRPLPHHRTGASTDFLFVAHGRRLGQTRLRNGLVAAVESCGLRGTGGAPLVVTPHQLRHTWATELANAGMSLQALMALLGHVTPQMTLRYATLASPTLRDAYDQAMGKMRRRFTLTPIGNPSFPTRSVGSAVRCSKLVLPMATAPATKPPAPVPTPTSARPATTSSPDRSSAAHSRRNAPTSRPSRSMLVTVVGSTKPAGTTASPTR